MTPNLDEMIIPFGKYKGESILKLYEDTKYLKWCQDQPWFKDKYSNIYNIVINQTIVNNNNGDKTPEHNKIQNLFLNKDLCVKLFNKFYNYKILKEDNGNYYTEYDEYNVCIDHKENSKFMKSVYEKCEKCCNCKRTLSCNACENCINHKYSYSHKCTDNIIEYNICGKHCEDSKFVKNLIQECKNCILQTKKRYEDISIEFEAKYNWDVIIESNNYRRYNFYIEIKPLLGEDYPNVLRKMKNQITLTKKDKTCNKFKAFLILNNFNSVNTTKENLIEIFKQSNIYVIFLNELDIELENFMSIEDENKILKEYLKSKNIDINNILKNKDK